MVGFLAAVVLLAVAGDGKNGIDENYASHESQSPLRVASDWEPDEAIGSAAAEAKLRAAVQQWLAATRPSAAKLASPENLTRLLAWPGVQRRESTERKERPYGTVWRSQLSVELPPAAVEAWLAELLAESRQASFWRSGIWAAACCGVFAMLLAARFVDRWTRGYRRRELGVLLAAMNLLVLAAAWTLAR